MSLRKALLAATILALPVAAQAQPVTGLYLGAGAGANLLMDTSVNATAPGIPQRTGEVRFQDGIAIAISLGWGYGNGFRSEIEASYRHNSVEAVSGLGTAPVTAVAGAAKTTGFMLNGLYDFDLGASSFFHPYVGLGVGYVVHGYDDVQQNSPTGLNQLVRGNWGVGYQAILGAAFPISPNVSLTAEYRYVGSLDPKVDAYRWGPGGRGQGGTAEVENGNHSLMLGVRYAFGAAPAAAPVVAPAAAPAPARTFLVFFDFDRAELTDRARTIIAEAATASTRVQTTRIEVSGHADRSGTPQYNQRLSERRAAAVAAELERRGVPRSAMVIQAFGESRPLVPTADGVREPQNRRVEIVLR